MKTLIYFAFVLVLCVSVIFADEQYTDKFDNVDIDEILNNDRLLNNYVNCLLDKGNCTPDAQELKSHIAEALETDCAKCSEKQRTAIMKVIIHIAKNKPDIWTEFQAKYDPDGKYKVKYADLLKKEGIN